MTVPVERRRLVVADLEPCEQRIVWSLRVWLEDPGNLRRIEREFWLACGIIHVEAALRGFEGMLAVLNAHSRRVLGLHRPSCPRVSADERTLLALLAALQAGEEDHAAALVRWLVPAHAAADLVGHASELALAMTASGAVLPHPLAPSAHRGEGARRPYALRA